MYVDSEHLRYKYVVSSSDNYLVLSRRSSVSASWDKPQTIDVYVQYLNPSIVGYETTRSFSTSQSFSEIDVSDSFYSRADCMQISILQIMLIFMILFFINGLTRFVKKGGVFFGN